MNQKEPTLQDIINEWNGTISCIWGPYPYSLVLKNAFYVNRAMTPEEICDQYNTGEIPKDVKPLWTFPLDGSVPLTSDSNAYSNMPIHVPIVRTSNKIRYFYGSEGKEIFPETCECGSGSNIRSPGHSDWCKLKQ